MTVWSGVVYFRRTVQYSGGRVYVHCAERIERTIEIEKKSMEIEEKGVKLRLTIVDTPGFNDSVDARHWYVSTTCCC